MKNIKENQTLFRNDHFIINIIGKKIMFFFYFAVLLKFMNFFFFCYFAYFNYTCLFDDESILLNVFNIA
jgi:hypothetical protein